jgi:hypothetical protein
MLTQEWELWKKKSVLSGRTNEKYGLEEEELRWKGRVTGLGTRMQRWGSLNEGNNFFVSYE